MGLCASTAGGPGLIPGQELESHVARGKKKKKRGVDGREYCQLLSRGVAPMAPDV